MAQVLTKEFFDISRADEFRIVPLGDIHLGSVACDEVLLQQVISGIEKDPYTYWVGLGDYAECIGLSDPRSQPELLADWVMRSDLRDVSGVQSRRFIKYVAPIAHKCLGLILGNHEYVIHKKYERNIYNEIVMGVKKAANLGPETPLALGYAGWLILKYYQSSVREANVTIKISLHHGFVGGRLKGAKGLNMERWLWNHECDLAIFGHSHNADTFSAAVERVDRNGNLYTHVRKGCYCGTFLRSYTDTIDSSYSEMAGYFPNPTLGVDIFLKPGAQKQRNRVRLLL